MLTDREELNKLQYTQTYKKLHTFIKKNKEKNKLVALYGVIENNLKQF